jgi:hypothetical protein
MADALANTLRPTTFKAFQSTIPASWLTKVSAWISHLLCDDGSISIIYEGHRVVFSVPSPSTEVSCEFVSSIKYESGKLTYKKASITFTYNKASHLFTIGRSLEGEDQLVFTAAECTDTQA